jgi:hypothetical protein
MNPKLQYCKCGYSWTPGTYHKIMMLLKGEYVWTCPRCQSRLTFPLIGHVVKVDTVKVLDERIWKR